MENDSLCKCKQKDVCDCEQKFYTLEEVYEILKEKELFEIVEVIKGCLEEDNEKEKER